MNREARYIQQAAEIIRAGGVIAYPTEAVYGIGCDPFNLTAVKRIADIKKRPLEKSFILIAADWQYVATLTQPIDPALHARIMATWPGPITWVFPATLNADAPAWIAESIAIRITAHPVARALSEAIKGPLVSTSANRTGAQPITQWRDLKNTFKNNEIDYFVPGALGSALKPTEIRDARTEKILRAG